MKASLYILCFIILVSCRSNDPETSVFKEEEESIVNAMNAIKKEARSEFANQMSKQMELHPSYKSEFRAIKTEFEAYSSVQKYHRDVRDFYTRRFMNQFDQVMMSGSMVNETTRPLWLSQREQMKDVIPRIMATDILGILKEVKPPNP